MPTFHGDPFSDPYDEATQSVEIEPGYAVPLEDCRFCKEPHPEGLCSEADRDFDTLADELAAERASGEWWG